MFQEDFNAQETSQGYNERPPAIFRSLSHASQQTRHACLILTGVPPMI